MDKKDNKNKKYEKNKEVFPEGKEKERRQLPDEGNDKRGPAQLETVDDPAVDPNETGGSNRSKN